MVKKSARRVVSQLPHHTNSRQLHLLSTDQCPVVVDINEQLNTAKLRVEQGTVDADDFDDENRGVPAEVLLDELLRTRPDGLDAVVTHGDFCLDNLFAQAVGGQLEFSGFIDMDRGGVQDRYQDLAIALRCVRRHLDPKLEALFLEHYGLVEHLDLKKVRYFMLLDEFF